MNDDVKALLDRVLSWSPQRQGDVIEAIRSMEAQVAETRELVEPPCIVVYEVHSSTHVIEVLAIFHARQTRKI